MGNVHDDSSSGEMTFFEHLDALRPHLVRAAASIFVLMIAAFLCHNFIIDKLLMGPHSPDFPLNRLFDYLADRWDSEAIRINGYQLSMINTKVQGQFNLHIKISIVTAIVFAIPYAVWELWRFIKPALTEKELAGSRTIVFYVSLCFFTGVLFGYFIIVPLTLNFFLGYVIMPGVANMIDIGSYLSTVLNASLACGVLFLLPVLIYFLAKMGIMTPSFMRKYRRHAFIVLLVFSAIITPPDVFSLVLVILPLYGLYEVGIVIAARVEKKKALQEEQYDYDEDMDEEEEEEEENEETETD